MLTPIHTFLAETLSESEIAALLKSYDLLSPAAQKEAVQAGLLLSDFSKKAAIEYFQIAPRVLKIISEEEIAGWVGMGIMIAQSVSASGIRYFREGPGLLSKISERATREAFIQLGIALAKQNPNLAMEYYRSAPVILSERSLSTEALSDWAQFGLTLGDYTLAVEYFRISPSLLKAISVPMLPYWIGIAKTLADAKLYDGITFMRTSPEILLQVKTDALPFLTFLGILSEQDPKGAMTCFQKAIEILSGIPASQKTAFLTQLLTIAQWDVKAGLSLFLHVTKIFKETGEAFFILWIEEGIALLKQGDANHYFSFESSVARKRAERLKGGMFLSSCANVLQHFAEGLCGRAVKIKSIADLDPAGDLSTGNSERPTTDGKAIYLPPHIRFFEASDQNFEWYKIATAFQAGFLEFATFHPNQKEMEPLATLLEERYQRKRSADSLSALLALFPKPDLIDRLFEIAEAARIEFLLKREYPGLIAGITQMRQDTSSPSALTAEPSTQEILIDALFQVSTFGRTTVQIPDTLQPIFFNACLFLGATQSPEATVIHSMKAAASVYNLLDSNHFPEVTGEMELLDAKGERSRGRGDMSASAGGQSDLKLDATRKAQSRFVHGAIDPKRVEETSAQETSSENPETHDPQTVDRAIGEGNSASRTAEEGKQTGDGGTTQKTGGACYDEWDCEANTYRRQFCRVHEESGLVSGKGGEAFFEAVMHEYKAIAQSLKRTFQSLTPKESVWVTGERDGERFDFDRLVQNRIEARISGAASDRIYVRREKKERSIAAAFLLDMSGSTERRLKRGKTILQIEKEALILLAHALDQIGDLFSIYGFSGQGPEQVRFHVLKNFQTRYTKEIAFCIGNAMPIGQNRDGAAIRHATAHLAREIAKTKILFLIGDGKPQDDHYAGSYAIADTKRALLEARQKGIRPVCIVVDPAFAERPLREEGNADTEHLKAIYGNNPYFIVDRIETLPEKLPKIYKRLTTG
ncbi:MAG: hypothetical protein AAB035_03770 [Nitrospirota bacterium]